MTCCARPAAPEPQNVPADAIPESRITVPATLQVVPIASVPVAPPVLAQIHTETSAPAFPPSGRQRLISHCTSLT
jgi:hypothetical protein